MDSRIIISIRINHLIRPINLQTIFDVVHHLLQLPLLAFFLLSVSFSISFIFTTFSSSLVLPRSSFLSLTLIFSGAGVWPVLSFTSSVIGVWSSIVLSFVHSFVISLIRILVEANYDFAKPTNWPNLGAYVCIGVASYLYLNFFRLFFLNRHVWIQNNDHELILILLLSVVFKFNIDPLLSPR